MSIEYSAGLHVFQSSLLADSYSYSGNMWLEPVPNFSDDAVLSNSLPLRDNRDKLHFDFLLGQWHAERGIRSSLTDIFLCPSHLRIIAMGRRALPLIFAQMRAEGDDPDLWFVALRAITGENPVTDDAAGDPVRMARAWLSWSEGTHDW